MVLSDAFEWGVILRGPILPEFTPFELPEELIQLHNCEKGEGSKLKIPYRDFDYDGPPIEA